jgi:hypothetical protein
VPDESVISDTASMPAAARVEQLSEEGQPVVETSYEPPTVPPGSTSHRGCAVANGAFMIALAALWLLTRRKNTPSGV